ncbi:transposase [Paraburkholderia antibiotica]|uniref:Transposase n=1 Tax=Paraburkholderia antibiotica TaxID=2728839 RepID=A0A7X9ZWS2_9BURK|nr:transposase [Paraburkholderia antibiotica]NML31252.1 transposase [Paraburkholderia antibiotica]
MFFDELNNDEWALLAPLVSDEPAIRLNRRGRPRAEPRIVTNAVLWILTTGEPWSKLPGRYPSGPTCRRRFEEWQLNGTLLEMVHLLSQSGRTFAYIPQPAPPVTARPAAPVAQTPSPRDDGPRGVSWKSPESWQAPSVSSVLSQWRSADPIADITRQLSGLADEATAGQTYAAMPVEPAVERTETADVIGAMDAVLATADTAKPRGTSVVEGAASTSASAALSSHAAPLPDDRRASLSMSLALRGAQLADPRGYLIYVVVEQVPNAMYRAWAEITRDGRRVERSGLVGPRFAVAQDAQQFAFDWARQWIDRDCATDAAAAALAVQAAAQAVTTTGEVAGESAAWPDASSGHMPSPVTRARPGLRQVPEPMPTTTTPANGAAGHGPLHTPLTAFRGPLRRYPADPAAAGSVANGAGATNTTAESATTERFSSAYAELISHVG